ncbi:hypothetical protein AURDEDRAFT_175312 [Auricularia subglabra TFB-10046 SS5]|nr:hypothetical protein AURDEDRAFT_175312 [Auricularia subglabra TFB-10046 SS5]
MSIHLPAELVDMDIDHLSSDRPALSACALVANSWTPRTRIWLFRAIHVGVGKPFETHVGRCHADLFPSSRFTYMSFYRFVRYLRRAKQLVAHLQDLRLVLCDFHFDLSANAFIYMLSQIPTPFAIHRLHVDTQDPYHALLVLRGLRPHISSLDMCSLASCPTGTSQLSEIMSLYPELRTIYHAYIVYDDDLGKSTQVAETPRTSPGDKPAPSRTFIIFAPCVLSWASRHLRPNGRLFVYNRGIIEHSFPETVEAVRRTKWSIYGMGISIERESLAMTSHFIESLPSLSVLQLTYGDDYYFP